MFEPLLLIVDPDSTRRHQLIRDCLLASTDLRVVGAAQMAEAVVLLTARKPRRVAVVAAIQDSGVLAAQARRFGAELVTFDPEAEGRPETVQRLTAGFSAAPTRLADSAAAPAKELILIGASTGGIAAIETVLRDFPADCPPVLIVQHIREGFVDGLIRRLDQMLAPQVRAASEGGVVTHGTVHVAARSDRHLGLVLRGGVLRTQLLPGTPVAGHCPSVDVLFREGATLASQIDVRAALLTGMGADGADGMCALHAAGAHTIAQDRDSSVVWGMPRMAIERGGVVEVLALSRIADGLLRRPIRQRPAIPLRRGSYL